MREIKFRYVWQRITDKKIWIEEVPIECLERKGDKPFVLKDNSMFKLISRDLYTKFKDKNEKEIYGNSLIQFQQEIYVVKMRNGSWCLWKYDESGGRLAWYLHQISGTEYFEVGNIHENPELLEGK